MVNWEKIKTFYNVAMVGSFTRAAEELNITQSALSRSIMQLEYDLKTKLFYRTIRGLDLTQEGQALFKIAQRMAAEAKNITQLLENGATDPKGLLTIATTPSLATMWLPYYMNGFFEKYPDMRLKIVAKDEDLDLTARQADVSIHPLVLHQDDLMQEYLLTFKPKAFASPEYLEKYGYPKKPADLDHHRLITYSEDYIQPYGNVNWILYAGRPTQIRTPFLRITTGAGLLAMAEAGLGICAISDEYPAVKHSKKLVRILPDFEGPGVKIYYSYPKQLKDVARIRCLGDYLKSVLSLEK